MKSRISLSGISMLPVSAAVFLVACGPASLEWEYDPAPPERFFSFFISGAQRLPNGNTLVNQGAGAKLREVTPEGEIVREYRYVDYGVLPDMLFRANRYLPDHPGILKLIPLPE